MQNNVDDIAIQEIPQPETDTDFVVAALYKFVMMEDLPLWQAKIRAICDEAEAMGTLLIADEGLNGTISAPYQGMVKFITWLRSQPSFEMIDVKYALHETKPFHRMKVRLKKEIVTMGCPDINPAQNAGTYVEPQEWNKLISDPNVMVIDTRNQYETAIGSFKGAVDPQTASFREFPQWAKELSELPKDQKPKKLAMFCTGGIRCEKSTALMRHYGFDEVYHLKGGILKYFEDVPYEESLWDGECFVFDSRVSVDHKLDKGIYELCYACRMPVTDADMDDERYLPGISCPHCFETKSEEQLARYKERQRQMALARQRGEAHIGRS